MEFRGLPPETSTDLLRASLVTADRFATLNASLSGRDKLFRAVQYGAKLASYIVEQRLGKDAALVQQLARLASGFSVGRRFIRMGSLPPAIQGWFVGLHEPNPLLRSYNIIAKAAGIFFLALDHCGYLAKQGMFRWNTEFWRFWDCFFWFVSLWFTLLYDSYRYIEHAQDEERVRQTLSLTCGHVSTPLVDSMAEEYRQSLLAELQQLRAKRLYVVSNLVKNLADLPISMDGMLKFSRVPPWVWHLLGLLSSVTGCYQKWPSQKPQPAVPLRAVSSPSLLPSKSSPPAPPHP